MSWYNIEPKLLALKNGMGVASGLLLLFGPLLFLGFSLIYQGIRGIFQKSIFLVANKFGSQNAEGASAIFWGIIYVLLGTALVGGFVTFAFLILSMFR